MFLFICIVIFTCLVLFTGGAGADDNICDTGATHNSINICDRHNYSVSIMDDLDDATVDMFDDWM
jgi:hypothetical protein